MNKVRIFEDQKITLANGIYQVRIRVLEVPKSLKFPDGVKVSCVLIETVSKNALLLLDNHQPFGYHIHTELPHEKI